MLCVIHIFASADFYLCWMQGLWGGENIYILFWHVKNVLKKKVKYLLILNVYWTDYFLSITDQRVTSNPVN